MCIYDKRSKKDEQSDAEAGNKPLCASATILLGVPDGATEASRWVTSLVLRCAVSAQMLPLSRCWRRLLRSLRHFVLKDSSKDANNRLTRRSVSWPIGVAEQRPVRA